MNIVLKKASTKTRMAVLASDALAARLYVPGWQLLLDLKKIKKLIYSNEYITSVAVAYMNNIPIGVCLSQRWYRYKNPSISVFVRKKYRRYGIGTKLVKKIMGNKPGFKYSNGVDGSLRFFGQFKRAKYI